MSGRLIARRAVSLCACLALTTTGCGFHGINSLPLPGAAGRGPGALTYHIQIANVATLEPNSPVMVGDVIVGSVDTMTFTDWHADVGVSVKPDAIVPANAVATVGQTSLLGSMHLSLNPPLGQPATGRLRPGSTLPLNTSSTYPSTERTLSSLSAVVNAGGLGQIGDIIHNLNTALSGHEGDVRELLNRLSDLVGVLDTQRDSINTTISALDHLSATLAGQTPVIDRALRAIPPALDVLIKERPRFIAALDKLHQFADVATKLVGDTQQDLVTNLHNLEPTLRALADVGDKIDDAVAYATTFPFTQNIIDRGLHGDYMNEFVVLDLTIPRLKRTLLLGTRWGDQDAKLVPAPGEPYYGRYAYDPVTPPTALSATPPPSAMPLPEAPLPPAPVMSVPQFPPMDEGGQ